MDLRPYQTKAIAAPVRDKLIGALELAVRGATDGEQLAACTALARILEAHKLRWSDLIAGAVTQDEAPAADPDDDFAVVDQWPGGWRQLARACVKYGASIFTEWEIQFCRNLAIARRPSPKQAAILRRLSEKLTLEGAFA